MKGSELDNCDYITKDRICQLQLTNKLAVRQSSVEEDDIDDAMLRKLISYQLDINCSFVK